MGWYGDYKPYVPVAQRRAQAAREVARRLKKGQVVSPVRIDGQKIVTTFWGKAWCENLEKYSDYANRLPRGRTYVRNGSVLHLAIEKGRIKALVSGSELYEIEIEIAPLAKPNWVAIKKQCAGKIGTIVELLRGKLSAAVMGVVTDGNGGLFPKPREIKMACSCPDSAGLCKHLAAVMYGIGNRLDSSPELLFTLRDVNHAELIDQEITAIPAASQGKASRIAPADLGAIFDIDLGDEPAQPAKAKASAKSKAKPAATKAVAKPPVTKAVAKPPVTKATVKPAPAKASAKATAKPVAAKAVAQPAPTKMNAKPVPAKAVAKPVTAKAVAVKKVTPTKAKVEKIDTKKMKK